MNFLVTFGATREPIDGVRFLTNFSSGRTGAAIVDELVSSGHSVTGLIGQGSAKPSELMDLIEYGDFADLNSKISSLVSSRSWDAVIHLAAVSDYSVQKVETADGRPIEQGVGKLDSGDDLVVRLKRNFKILGRIKGYAGASAPRVVAFKLTNTPDLAARAKAVTRLFEEAVDLVVHNDLSEIRAGAHRFTVYRSGAAVRECDSISILVRRLLEELV